MFKKDVIEKNKFERYQDPTGEFSNKQLKWGEWYLRHKLLLQKIGTTILVVWCVVTIGYGFGYLGYYLVVGYSQDQAMYNNQVFEFQNYEVLQALYKPQDLQVRQIQTFESAPDVFDFSAQVINPNERWIAYIDYKYKYTSGETGSIKTVILPGEIRPVIYFGASMNGFPSRAELIFENISWKKVDNHYIKDVKKFVEQRKKFEFDNFKFTRAGKASGMLSNMLEFDLVNVSAFSYWSPEFVVELLDNQIVGYFYILEEKFKSGETRHVDIRSLVGNLNVSDIKIYPIIDLFDPSQYVQPGE